MHIYIYAYIYIYIYSLSRFSLSVHQKPYVYMNEDRGIHKVPSSGSAGVVGPEQELRRLRCLRQGQVHCAGASERGGCPRFWQKQSKAQMVNN